MKKLKFTILVLVMLPCLSMFVGCDKPRKPFQEDMYVLVTEAGRLYGAYIFYAPTSTKTEQEHFEALSLRAEEICTEKLGNRKYDNYYIKIFYNVISDKPQFFQIEYDNQYLITGVIENDEYYELIYEERSSEIKKSALKEEKIYLMMESGFVVTKGIDRPVELPFFFAYKNNDLLCHLSGEEVGGIFLEKWYQSSKAFVITPWGAQSGYVCSLDKLKVHKRTSDEAYYRFYIPEFNSNYTEQEHVERINKIANERLIELSNNESSYLSCDTQILYSLDEKPMYFLVTYRTDGSSIGGVKVPQKYDVGIIIDDVYYLIMETDDTDKTMQFKEIPEKIYYSPVNVFAYKKDGKFEELGSDKFSQANGFWDKFELNYFAVKDKPNPTVTDAFDLYEP